MERAREMTILEKDSYSDFELIDRFIEDCRLRDYSPETIRSYHSNLRTIARYLDSIDVRFLDIDKHALKQILIYLKDEKRVVHQTQKSYFSALSSFFKHLIFEDIHDRNPVPPFMEHYLRRYKNNYKSGERKLISVEEMGMLINGILDPRDKAINTLFAKTGIRRGALIDIDIHDIDWNRQCIKIKARAKRSNPYVFFDDETAIILRRWLRTRENYSIEPGVRALFIGEHGKRLKRHGVTNAVIKHAERLGLYDRTSKEMEDHFTPHCHRHWFTTNLRRNGMIKDFIKELRGDSRKEAMDIYDHIDLDELRQAYRIAIPILGIA